MGPFLYRCILLYLTAFWLMLGQALAEPVVSGIRIGTHPDFTRFVLDVNEPVTFKSFVLDNPDRIVIDLPHVEWRPENTVFRPRGVITSLRYGAYKADSARIVIDLKHPAIVSNANLLPPGKQRKYRLVFDLRTTSRAAFTALSNNQARLTANVQPAATAGITETTSKTVRQTAIPIPRLKAAQGPKKTIVVDPGHGGIDPGASSARQYPEKKLTLLYARALKHALEETGRYRVVLTRNRDFFVSLRDRVEVARKANADLFLSLHADSIEDREFRGGAVYTLSEHASDKEAARLAAKENRADVLAGVDLGIKDDDIVSILIDLAQRETMNFAATLASHLVNSLKSGTHMRNKPHRFAGFLVLKAPDVPSVLLELGYLSNKAEERFLRSQKGQRGITKSIVQAIDAYFSGLHRDARR